MNHVLENYQHITMLNIPRCISVLTPLAGLLHDIGKATLTFNGKLVDNALIGKDVLRHERLSCAVLSSLFCLMLDKRILSTDDDADFFSTLAKLPTSELKALFQEAIETKRLKHSYTCSNNDPIQDLSKSIWNNDEPFNTVVFNALFFLILSHHKMPHHQDNCEDDIIEQGYVNERNKANDIEWHQNAPFLDDNWLNTFQTLCNEISSTDFIEIYNNIEAFTTAIIYYARPAFIIADQNITAEAVNKAQTNPASRIDEVAYANSYTDEDGKKHMAQPLTEHLLSVANAAQEMVVFMFNDIMHPSLPSISNAPKALIDDTSHPKFLWQNEALNIANTLPNNGNLVLVSADTGAGKTRAIAKITSAIRKHLNVRFTTLLGMNTLTKQTATEYITEMKLGYAACAITGHALTRYEIKQTLEAADGCENHQEVSDFKTHNLSEFKNTLPKQLKCEFKPKYNQILETPVVVATIDHIIESIQSGKSTPSRLLQRLQTSDIIIDEIDSYSAESLVAIYKLVFIAGFYNRNIIVSSATLRPAVANELLNLFALGMQQCNAIFNTTHKVSGAVINNAEATSFSAKDITEFRNIIKKQQKAVYLNLLNKKNTPKRRLDFINAINCADIYKSAKYLHNAHHVDFQEFNLSAGVIRFNNVKYVNAFSRALSTVVDDNTEIGVINYHSRIPGPVRYRVEQCLDRILKRNKNKRFEAALLAEPAFIQTLAKAKARNVKNIILIVVCSPIEETGRDHCFDWGITEPCSNHSLIQLAGRIRRHRDSIDLTIPNMLMLERSLKEVYEPEYKPYLTKPGAEFIGQMGKDIYNLTLNEDVNIDNAFSFGDINYKTTIDARACLIDYPKQKVTIARYNTLNEIEVQQVHNASSNIADYTENSHKRITVTHAENYPLRSKNDDTPCWFNGENWVIPENRNSTAISSATVKCDWRYDLEPLPNLWFDSSIEQILNEIGGGTELQSLLCSEFSSFGIKQNQIKKMGQTYFRIALGLVNLTCNVEH